MYWQPRAAGAAAPASSLSVFKETLWCMEVLPAILTLADHPHCRLAKWLLLLLPIMYNTRYGNAVLASDGLLRFGKKGD